MRSAKHYERRDEILDAILRVHAPVVREAGEWRPLASWIVDLLDGERTAIAGKIAAHVATELWKRDGFDPETCANIAAAIERGDWEK